MRRAALAVVVAAATLGTGVAAVGAVAAVRSGEALPGVTLVGIDVGGQDRPALVSRVEGLASDRTTGSLPVTADDERAGVDRSLLDLDVQATVDRLLRAGRDGYPASTVLGPLLGTGERAVEPVLSADDRGLAARVAEIAEQVDREPAAGALSVTTADGAVAVSTTPPSTGRTLEQDAARKALAAALLTGQPGPLDLPVTVEDPPATAEQVQAVGDAAERAVAGAYVLATGSSTITVSPLEIAPLLAMQQESSGPRLTLDEKALADLVTRKAEPVGTRPVDATFDVAGTPATIDAKGDLRWTPRPAEIRIVPAKPGRGVDVPSTTAELAKRVLAGERAPAPLPITDVAPALTTEQAKAAGVRTLMGTFTTYYTAGQPRATNIRRIAEIVNGSYVGPGKTFSLNGAAGARTKARGFVADGAIVDGELTDEVGGGVSQFATTLFNAAFFAGLPIPEHKPHSFYISRYPAGRESTVYFGALDVKVVNNTAHGMLIRTRSTPGSVTVELYGDNGGRQVSSTSGPRRPTEKGGFRIAVTRQVSGGDGKDGRRVFTTTYDPPPAEE